MCLLTNINENHDENQLINVIENKGKGKKRLLSGVDAMKTKEEVSNNYIQNSNLINVLTNDIIEINTNNELKVKKKKKKKKDCK